jgi:hypothetical protein
MQKWAKGDAAAEAAAAPGEAAKARVGEEAAPGEAAKARVGEEAAPGEAAKARAGEEAAPGEAAKARAGEEAGRRRPGGTRGLVAVAVPGHHVDEGVGGGEGGTFLTRTIPNTSTPSLTTATAKPSRAVASATASTSPSFVLWQARRVRWPMLP